MNTSNTEVNLNQKQALAKELAIANKKLAFQNEEKDKRAAELAIANKELAFQNEEKDKRAAELAIANKELAFQNNEKDKRAAELSTANKELAFQNEEKDKRAAELAIANKEMAFQNKEKDKRAAELATANIELAFQNEEKDKRAAELAIANKELAFQNGEKEKRAAELIIADKELEFQSGEKEKRAVELITAQTDVKELEGLNIHKENILSTISHDLRSPLAGIIQIAELLKHEFKNMEDDELQNMLDHLYTLTIEELAMLDYLVEWARIKYAAEAYTPAQINLSQYVNKVFDTLNEMAESQNVLLYNKIKEDVTVFADGKMLLSIIQNIVSNSIKHTLPGGKVTAFAKREGDKIIIEIKDTGIGMSQEFVKKLFAPQMGILSNVRKENKGAGIGLLLIKGFVDKNGGEIWVESTQGKGTSFYFSLLVEETLDELSIRLN